MKNLFPFFHIRNASAGGDKSPQSLKNKFILHPLSLTGMAWRNLFTRPGRTILTLFGIALGVAAILATSITNRNVANTLDGLFKRTVGSAELQVMPLANKESIKESSLDLVRRSPGVSQAVPIIKTSTILVSNKDHDQSSINSSGVLQLGGTTIEIIGIDPALEPSMRLYVLDSGKFIVPGEYEVLIPKLMAEDNDLTLGKYLSLHGPEGQVNLKIKGFLTDEGAAMLNSGNVIFVPIDMIQKMFDLENGYSEINIKVEDDISNDPAALSTLKTELEDRLARVGRVSYPSGRSDLVPRMASTYQFTLSFFSVVAIFMGVFLIYNTFATTILERTQEIGMLRALGMQRRQVMGQVLTEAGILSILGCFLGLTIGILLSRGLMALMRGFFQVEANTLAFSFGDLFKSIGFGLLGTFVASYLPARQAASISPIEALALQSKEGKKQNANIWKTGLLVLGLSLVSMVVPSFGSTQFQLVVRMLGLILFLIGAVLTIPLVVIKMEPVTHRIASHFYGGMGELGARNVLRSMTRTMVTIASLSISLIMIIEVNSLVFVMKKDVSNWLDNAMGADILVKAPYSMNQSFARKLASIDGILSTSPTRVINVEVADTSLTGSKDQVDSLSFLAIDPVLFRQVGNKQFVASQGDPENIWRTFEQGGSLFVSSVVADQFDLQQGSFLYLRTRRGDQAFKVAATTSEFDQDGMVITGTYEDLREYFGENGADMYSVKVAPDSDINQVAQTIRDRYEKSEGIQVQTTNTFKTGVMALYDQLSSLFNVLGLLGVIIGTMGLLNTMTMNVLERIHELGMLRALGSLSKQVTRMVLAEALIIGLVSALYGVIFGYFLSRILVTVANLISGYDLQYAFTFLPYLFCLVIAFGVSQLATLGPARRAARVNIIQALKHE